MPTLQQIEAIKQFLATQQAPEVPELPNPALRAAKEIAARRNVPGMQGPQSAVMPPAENPDVTQAKANIHALDNPTRQHPAVAIMNAIAKGTSGWNQNPAQFQQQQLQERAFEDDRRNQAYLRNRQVIADDFTRRAQEDQASRDKERQEWERMDQERQSMLFPEQLKLAQANVGLTNARTTAELRPPTPPTPAPRTVTTEEGVFTLNPDGTRGNRLGNRPQSASQASQPNTPFEVWSQQNPGRPVEEWLKLSNPQSGLATVAEKRSLGFFDRVNNAVLNIDQMSPEIAKLGLGGQVRLNNAPNLLQTPLGKRFNQATGEFINAALRRESGAAIQQSEYDRFAKIYFPQPGDDEATLAQKKQSRDAIIQSLKTESGKAYSSTYGEEPGKGNVAPEGTVITDESGNTMVKRGGKWVKP